MSETVKKTNNRAIKEITACVPVNFPYLIDFSFLLNSQEPITEFVDDSSALSDSHWVFKASRDTGLHFFFQKN